MPRNEFMNHDPLEGMTDLQIQDQLRMGQCTLDDVRRHRGLPDLSGEGQKEVPSQDDGSEYAVAEGYQPMTFAELRKSGRYTTEALVNAERAKSSPPED